MDVVWLLRLHVQQCTYVILTNVILAVCYYLYLPINAPSWFTYIQGDISYCWLQRFQWCTWILTNLILAPCVTIYICQSMLHLGQPVSRHYIILYSVAGYWLSPNCGSQSQQSPATASGHLQMSAAVHGINQCKFWIQIALNLKEAFKFERCQLGIISDTLQPFITHLTHDSMLLLHTLAMKTSFLAECFGHYQLPSSVAMCLGEHTRWDLKYVRWDLVLWTDTATKPATARHGLHWLLLTQAHSMT